MISRTTTIGAGLACALAGTAVFAARPAAPPSSYVQSLERCQAIAGPTERLSCFDTAAAALVSATKRGDTTIVDRAEVREVRKSLFGFAMPKLPFFRGDDTAGVAADMLESKITAVRSLGYGKWRMTLADGDAVWETTESDSTMDDPRPGQSIKLKRGALGRYVLSINGQRGVTGRRVG